MKAIASWWPNMAPAAWGGPTLGVPEERARLRRARPAIGGSLAVGSDVLQSKPLLTRILFAMLVRRKLLKRGLREQQRLMRNV